MVLSDGSPSSGSSSQSSSSGIIDNHTVESRIEEGELDDAEEPTEKSNYNKKTGSHLFIILLMIRKYFDWAS